MDDVMAMAEEQHMNGCLDNHDLESCVAVILAKRLQDAPSFYRYRAMGYTEPGEQPYQLGIVWRDLELVRKIAAAWREADYIVHLERQLVMRQPEQPWEVVDER